MKDKVVNNVFEKIKKNNHRNFDDVKLEEIKYGLYGLYTLITKTTVIILLALILNMFDYFIVFLVFYCLIRSVGYGVHAKSNLQCWIFSTVLLLGIPYFFVKIEFSSLMKTILWSICFINYLIFCPADTEKRPMISKVRKLRFKLVALVISILYLILIFKFDNLSSLILGGMLLEALLTNPLGYIIMGHKPRFRLNDLNIFKLN